MNVTLYDIFLLSPELVTVVLGLSVLGLDLIRQRKDVVPWLAFLGLLLPLICTIAVYSELQDQGPQTVFAGALVVDHFALYLKFLIISASALVLLASMRVVSGFHPNQAEFYGLLLLSSSGLMLLPATGNLITLYVALELASLPVIALAAYDKTSLRSTEAGLKYLLLSAIASAFLLYGFAFLYGATGTLQLVSGDPKQPAIIHMLMGGDPALPFGGTAVLIGVLMISAGFGFKLSMAPFHMWTPDVYEGAPIPVVAYLSVASKIAAVGVVLRLLHVGLEPVGMDWSLMFAGLAGVTMTVGNLVAISQDNIKRLMGYSAIAQAGYLLIGVAAIPERSLSTTYNALGIESVLFYLGAYAATNLLVFFVIMAVTHDAGDETLEKFSGLAHTNPLVAIVLTLGLLSLIGIPATAGFMGKLFLFNSAVNANLGWLALVGVINSVISAYYYVRVIRMMYFGVASPLISLDVGRPMRCALGVTAILVLVLGLWPRVLLDVVRVAAENPM